MAAPRLVRIAGLFAVGLAALVAGTSQASAACSLGVGLSGANLTIAAPTDDVSGTTSVTLLSGGTALTSSNFVASQHAVTLTITSEPTPVITGVNGGSDHTSGSTAGDNIFTSFTINGSNFKPVVTATLNGGNCDGQSVSVIYDDVVQIN